MAEKEFKIQNGLRVLEEAFFESSASITGALNVSSIVFEGTTSDNFETTLAVTDPTADRTITFPNATTTLVGTDTTDTLTNKTITGIIYTQTILTPTFTTNAYTLVLGDQGDILLASNGATAGTINVPLNSTVAFPTGTQITVVQTGAGQISFAGISGVTVNATPGLKLRAQYSAATLIKTDTNSWLLIGDLSE
jgi:hypothetical protein